MEIRWGKYEVKVKCTNCGYPSPVKVPKGMSVAEFIEMDKCKCQNCGCVIKPQEYETKWLK